MTLNYPSHNDIVNRTRSDVSTEVPGLDPATIFANIVRAITDSQSNRVFDVVLLLQQIEKQMFPQTSAGEFLEWWASYEGLTRNPATISTGPITITGTATTNVPIDTEFTSSSGISYKTLSSLTLASNVISITSLTRSGTTATAITSSDHNLATGINATIAGANETDYNGSFTITVLSNTSFSYTVSGSPATPATGTITATYAGGFVNVESLVANDSENGIEVNLDSGAALTLTTPIAGVDTTAYVQFDSVSGGSDVETDASLLSRTLQSRSNPVANFNPAAIEKEARKVSGVTRIKVKRITPGIGDVTILFVRDDDGNIIPDAGEVTDVKNAILEILPATSDPDDVIVTAPTAVTTDYTFASISPDTATMRTAIQTNLQAFYTDVVDFETDITEIEYNSIIIDTVDPETGEKLTAFNLSTPTSDISVGTDEIGVLGNVTFA